MSTCKECTATECDHDRCDHCEKCIVCGDPCPPPSMPENWPPNWPKPVKRYPFDRLEYERNEISCTNVIQSAQVH